MKRKRKGSVGWENEDTPTTIGCSLIVVFFIIAFILGFLDWIKVIEL
jgi:hypothetical protein